MNIHKVAELAGVSTATVSRVINRSGPVSEKNRLRVMDAIQELDYRPNNRAREFRMNRSYEIITILNDIRNPMFAEAIKGMEEVAYENNYHLLIGNTSNNKRREQTYLDALNSGKADGAILITPRMNKNTLCQLQERVPLILMNDFTENNTIPSIGINDFQASYDLTKHLIKEGHGAIGYLAGNHKVPIALERRNGYKQAMEEAQLPIQPQWIIESEHTIDGGKKSFNTLLETWPLPTALVCYNDEIAIGAIQQAQLKNIKIPEELSIVGFDNISTSTIISPALTTINQSTYEMGRQSVEMLIQLIEKKPLPKRRVTLDYDLIIRKSTLAYKKTSN